MKKKLLLLFAVLAMAVSASAEESFSATNAEGVTIYYKTINSSTCQVTYNSSYTSLTSVNIPESVSDGTNTYSVTWIGGSAFNYCSNLISVKIPESVTDIRPSAFDHCTGLTTVSIPNSVTTIGYNAFESCSALTSVVIGDHVTSVGEYAFKNCSKLTSVEIPNSVTQIETSAFYNCSALTTVTGGSSIETIGDNAFYGCKELSTFTIGSSVKTIGECAFQNCLKLNVTIPNSVTSIGSSAFWRTGLTSVTIPSSITTIEASTFSNCSSLTSVTIGNSVTTIGWDAFSSCTGLTSVVIPNSVTTIGNYAFQKCNTLTSVTIGNSVTSIGNDAFEDCTGLTSVTIPSSVTEIGSYAFYNTGLTAVEIPTTVTTIGTQAFTHCTSLSSFTGKFASDDHRCLIDNKTLIAFAPAGLTSYKIPDGVTTIGQAAFYSFKNLTWVTIPNSVETIETNAFANCSGLTSMVIPSSVTKIGQNAFHYCTNLTEIISLNTTVPITTSDPFYKVPTSCKVIVPNATAVSSYKGNQYWKELTITSEQVIYYTTSDGAAASLTDGAFTVTNPIDGTNIKLNEYNNETGKGEITFNGIVTTIGCGEVAPNDFGGFDKGAFESCTNLTSITIPNTVTEIGDEAFCKCTALASVTIPNSVTTIGGKAFYQCTDLTSVEIPSSVTSIGNKAFYNCTSLSEVTSYNTTAPTLGTNCFYNVAAGLAIKVPGAAIGDYNTAWSAYKNKLQAISLALTDAVEYTYNFSFNSGETTYTRNFPNDKWQGLFLPFSMNYNDWKDKGTMAELTGVNAEGVLQWTTIESGSIEAGTPYIFKPNGTGDMTFSVSDATLASCDSKTDVTYGDYTLSGTYTTKTDMATSKAYALSNGNFYYTTSDTKTLKPYRIFLTVPESVYATKAPIRSIINGMEVTAIEGMDVDFDIDNHGQQQYNLQGIRVDNSYKGIVIINGKKVLRK